MALPQLVKAGVSVSPVTLTRAPVYPRVEPVILNQFVGVSDANTIQVAVVGAPLKTLALQFQQLTPLDAANILAFLEDPLVNFGQNPFTYIDSLEVSHPVRWLEPQLALPEESDENFSWEPVFTKV